jgi:hypothetical protein
MFFFARHSGDGVFMHGPLPLVTGTAYGSLPAGFTYSTPSSAKNVSLVFPFGAAGDGLASAFPAGRAPSCTGRWLHHGFAVEEGIFRKRVPLSAARRP